MELGNERQEELRYEQKKVIGSRHLMQNNSFKRNYNPYYNKLRNPYVICFCIGYFLLGQLITIFIAHRVTVRYSFPTKSYDDTDYQWRSFRNFLPMISLFMVIFLILKRFLLHIYERMSNPSSHATSVSSIIVDQNANDLTLQHVNLLQIYYVVIGFFALLVLHGIEFLLALLPFVTLIYMISKYFKSSKYSLFFTWILCFVSLWICEYKLDHWFEGQKFYRLSVAFNMTFLRIISFVYDRWELNTRTRVDMVNLPTKIENQHEIKGCVLPKHHKIHQTSKNDICSEPKGLGNEENLDRISTCSNQSTDIKHGHLLNYSYRVSFGTNHDSEFTYLSFLAYLFYLPLYIAGPITTFNAFTSHLKKRQVMYSWKQIIVYIFRTVFTFTMLEMSLYFIHAPRITQMYRRSIQEYKILELYAISLWGLFFIYLKLNFIWKFFRLIALLDGIETPENMDRCMLNATSLTVFWRNWHASFNQWLIRYVYIPLGGNRKGRLRKLLSILLVFSFVAVWHDITLHLFFWGWLISLIYIPEVLGKVLSRNWRSYWWYDWLAAFSTGATFAILFFANLIGFVLGVEGSSKFLNFTMQDITPIIAVLLQLPAMMMIANEIRKYESYYGVKRNGF